MAAGRTSENDAGQATRSQWFSAALLLLIAWCTYLHIPLAPGGRLLVPSYPTVALLPVIFLTVRQDIKSSDVMFLLKITFLLLVSIALSPGYSFVQEKLFAAIQFVMAVAAAVLIVKIMQALTRQTVERVLLVIWCAILVGCILEISGVTRAASDAFREWAYSSTYGLYDADLRDVNMVGWLRPKLFSSEPSHVTKFFIASINAWLLIRVTIQKAIVAAGATVVMLVIMGSPMLLISGLISLAILMWDQRAKLSARIMIIAATVLVGIAVGAYVAQSTFSNVATRVSNVDETAAAPGNKLSGDERRIVLPYLTLIETWKNLPLFGVGVGGKEVVAQRGSSNFQSSSYIKGNNALADVGIYLGIVGGAVFFALLVRQARRSGVERVFLWLVLFVCFSQLMGGIDTFRYWGFIALLWGALAIADLEHKRELDNVKVA